MPKGSPYNLGTPVNTPWDELSPFVHVNRNTLYFASEGHVGMGGFDIFMAQRDSLGGWRRVRNVGYPINDYRNQTSFFVSRDGMRAYYTYERISPDFSRSSLLYEVELPPSIRPSQHTFWLRGVVRHAMAQKPLEALLSLYVMGADTAIYKIRSGPEGTYSLSVPTHGDMLLFVHKKGFLSASKRFFVDAEEGVETQKTHDFSLQPLKVGAKQVLQHVFFRLNSYELDTLSFTALQEMVLYLRANPSLEVAIAGHTDDSGTVEYNQLLSLQRAKRVAQFLEVHGILSSRLHVAGYGSARPLLPNTSAENSAKNRRITFEVIRL